MSKPSITAEQFRLLANTKHASKYVYHLTTEFVKAHQKIEIVCPKHGKFTQKTFHHLNGAGCKQCGIDARSGFNNLDWQSKAEAVASVIKNDHTWLNCNTVEITCTHHGINRFSYYRIKSAGGNPCCKIRINARKRDFDYYRDKLDNLYHNKYDYNQSSFNGLHQPIDVLCPKHGKFTVGSLLLHMRGSQCPLCAKPRSIMETQWLDELKIPIKYRNAKIIIDNKTYFADAYDQENNTVYEFWGDYYHGNPQKYNPDDVNTICKKTFGELYVATQAKITTLLSAGYNLVHIWETDYIQKLKKE